MSTPHTSRPQSPAQTASQSTPLYVGGVTVTVPNTKGYYRLKWREPPTMKLTRLVSGLQRAGSGSAPYTRATSTMTPSRVMATGKNPNAYFTLEDGDLSRA